MTTELETRPTEPVGRPFLIRPSGSDLTVQEWSDGQTSWWQMCLSATGMTPDRLDKVETRMSDQVLTLLDGHYPSRAECETAANQVRTILFADRSDIPVQAPVSDDLYAYLNEPVSVLEHSHSCNNLNCPG